MARYELNNVPAGTVGDKSRMAQTALTGSNVATAGLAVGRNAGATTFGLLSTTNTVFSGIAVLAPSSDGWSATDTHLKHVRYVLDGEIVTEFQASQTIEPGTIISWSTTDGKAISATTGAGRGKVIKKYTDTTALVLVQ